MPPAEAARLRRAPNRHAAAGRYASSQNITLPSPILYVKFVPMALDACITS
jgi:hypothetical protein